MSINSIVYMYHVFFILSSINGHLGCFHVLVIVYSAAVNIGVHVSLQTRFFSRYMLRSGIAGSYGSSAKLIQCFRFKNKIKKKKEPPNCSPVSLPIYIPTSGVCKGSLFYTLFPFIVGRLFWWWPFWMVWGDSSL